MGKLHTDDGAPVGVPSKDALESDQSGLGVEPPTFICDMVTVTSVHLILTVHQKCTMFQLWLPGFLSKNQNISVLILPINIPNSCVIKLVFGFCFLENLYFLQFYSVFVADIR